MSQNVINMCLRYLLFVFNRGKCWLSCTLCFKCGFIELTNSSFVMNSSTCAWLCRFFSLFKFLGREMCSFVRCDQYLQLSYVAGFGSNLFVFGKICVMVSVK